MRSSIATLLIVVVVGVIAVLLVGATKSDRLAQTLGVAPAGPISVLTAGNELCQRPIALASDLDAVRFTLGTTADPAPAVTVTLRSLSGRRVFGSGRLAPGYDVGHAQTVRVGRVRAGPDTQLCFRNEGPALVALYGDDLNGSRCTPTGGRQGFNCVPGTIRPTLSSSAPFVNGKPLGSDVSAVFLREESRSLLARVPDMLSRASLFRPGLVTPALWWLLIAGWLIAAPAGLVYALRRASASSG